MFADAAEAVAVAVAGDNRSWWTAARVLCTRLTDYTAGRLDVSHISCHTNDIEDKGWRPALRRRRRGLQTHQTPLPSALRSAQLGRAVRSSAH